MTLIFRMHCIKLSITCWELLTASFDSSWESFTVHFDNIVEMHFSSKLVNWAYNLFTNWIPNQSVLSLKIFSFLRLLIIFISLPCNSIYIELENASVLVCIRWHKCFYLFITGIIIFRTIYLDKNYGLVFVGQLSAKHPKMWNKFFVFNTHFICSRRKWVRIDYLFLNCVFCK